MPPKSFLLGGQIPPGRSAPVRLAPVAGGRRSWTGSSTAAAGRERAILGSERAASKGAPPPLAPRAAKGGAPLPRVPRLPENPLAPPEGYIGDSIDDALDDLLRQAAASLKHLDGIRAKLPPAQRQDADSIWRGKDRKKPNADSFWKPRCRSDLWGDDNEDFWGDLSDLDSDDDSDDASSAGIGVEEEELWNFLRKAAGAEPAGSAARTSARKASGPSSRASTTRSSQAEKPPPKPQRASGEAPPRAEEKSASGPADRARANGFRFGQYGSAAGPGARPPLPGASSAAEPEKPESKITAELNRAKADGPDAVRHTLKRLLLKWHPDKAPQGDSPDEVAARTEATRVLRHVLQERQRLGV